jgi:uncharacterized membrane protein (UPF0136 family)
LLPYQSFPHFHTPYLAYAYAGIFRLTDNLLVGGRLFSVLCATAILGTIGATAYHLFRPRGRWLALAVCAGTVLLALTTRLFTETSGYAWNHEPPLLLSLLACLALIAGVRRSKSKWFAVSGALLGLAIGTRLTYAPLIAPFGLAVLFHPSFAWRWKEALVFGAGLLVALSGLFYFFIVAPEQTLFDNFGFAKANVVYRFSTGEPRTMTVPTKLRFFWKLIVRSNAALFIAGLLPLLAVYLASRGKSWRFRMEVRFILLLLPFLVVGRSRPRHFSTSISIHLSLFCCCSVCAH